ncbi:hypothetical protein BUALT_Bualt14G0024600 [Buddleja alternifolia]|uniref:Uncharacterized protein n=1 Tax=Buddleja alternifolia TaxID=168488 RepID=A0AAV6WKY3_9LAMI|nr:hypothetical protein BUALT_Bualt14G0024600 [Buddleja alternifolia]
MLLTNAAKFKNDFRSHAIIWQRDIKFAKNDEKRVRAKCMGKNTVAAAGHIPAAATSGLPSTVTTPFSLGGGREMAGDVFKKHCPLKKSESGEAFGEPNGPIPKSKTPTVDVLVDVSVPECEPPTADANPQPKQKRRCSVCLQEGNNRAKCSTPAGKMWQNMDFYGYNCQKNPTIVTVAAVSAPPTASSSHLRHVASSHEQQTSQILSVFTLENPSVAAPPLPLPPPPASQASSVCIGGVYIVSSFKKKGKACVTLK